MDSHSWKRTAACLEVGEERSDCGDTQIPKASVVPPTTAYWALLGGSGGRGGFLEAVSCLVYTWVGAGAVGRRRQVLPETDPRWAGRRPEFKIRGKPRALGKLSDLPGPEERPYAPRM